MFEGTVHIRFDPSLQPRKIVNCHRDDLISPTGKLKTPLDHALDGKHPWHLETYPDIPQLNIIKLPLAAKEQFINFELPNLLIFKLK